MPKMKLTDTAVARLALAPGQIDMTVWDADLPGFGIRFRPTGRAWMIGYRPAGTGRAGLFKRLKIGTPDVLKTAEARAHARTILARIALGADPLGERAKAKAATTTTLGQILDRYEESLERRGYVNRRTVMATLRNRMSALLKRDVRTVTGAELAEIIASIEATGKLGAAKDFRTVSRAFFGWAMSEARVVASNPLAGYRKQRSTRIDKVAQDEHGRALSDTELAAVWRAADPETTLGRLVRFYILTGCRRGEGAGLTRAMLDRPAALIRLPPIYTKQGRGHIVPITSALAAMLGSCVIDSRSDLLFPSSRTGLKISGWSKMLLALQRDSGVEFGFHDLRRTLRTEVTQAAWDAIVRSPPARLTAGSLFHAANAANPAWRKPSDLRRLLEKFETPPEPVTSPPAASENEEEPFSMPIGANVPIISEDEAGIQFAEEYRGKLRFSVAHGRWFIWDGQIWRENTTNLAFTLTREHIRKMAVDHAEKVRIAAGKAAFAGAVERFARADRAFAVTADAWDRDPYLLGTPRGTVDLRTGELRPARPEDGITRSTAVAPADTADCPLWLHLLDQTFAGDAATVRFFQQWCGYSLTGDTREQSLVFGHGDGGNGKGVTINTIGRIAGSYTVTAAAETFVAAFGTRHSTELAMLAGARIVKASEMEKGQVWAEKRIKEITGGDEITARFMRQDTFTFLPAFKLIIIGNDIPDLNHVDDAMRRRFNLLPFHHKPTRPDPTLTHKLEAEWPAILRWMIDGCLDWQRNGLVRPECVLAATREYFADQDTLAHWATENCTIERDNEDLKEATIRLYGSWVSHAKAVGVSTGSEKAFARDLRTRFRLRPREKIPLPSGSRVRGFSGIALRSASFNEEA